jgi:HK97 family phage major capsid protein
MKVRMLLKSGFGAIRHGEVFDASPDDARLGFQVGFLAPVDAEAAALAKPERPRPDAPPHPGKSFADFCRAVQRKDTDYLARHYDSHFLPAETDHLSPEQKAALAESGGPVGGYTVPPEYADRMMTVAAENAVVRPNATVAPMQSATLQVPTIDMTTPQAAGVSPYFGGVQMKWTGEAQTRTESEPQFKQVELKAWELSGSAVVSRPLLDDGDAGALDVYLATVFGLALAWAEDYACLQGDGVAKPQGIVNSPAAATVTRQTGGQIQYADVAGMLAKLQPSSYDRAFWVHSPTAVPQLLQLKDGTSRAVLFGAGQEPDVRPRRRNWSLLGFPMFCSEKLPPLGTKGDLILIDPRYYLIGDRMQLSISASAHVNFLKNQVTFRLTRRTDGQPWIEKPITLQDGTTTASPFVVLN